MIFLRGTERLQKKSCFETRDVHRVATQKPQPSALASVPPNRNFQTNDIIIEIRAESPFIPSHRPPKMNASALLQSQGWRGEGHTLHATNDSIGLKNRLLVSRKANTSGLGASQYANDQWWLSALDEQLSGLTTKNGKITGTAKDGKLDRLKDGAGQSELYKFFISGGLLQGTVDKLPAEMGGKDGQSAGNVAAIDLKPRSFSISGKKSKTKSTVNGSEKETKEERRARKKAKQERRDQKQARREQKQARKEARKKKSSGINGVNGVSEATGETKEERRARREARRKRKEEKRRSKN